MSLPEIRSKAFQEAALRSERIRVIGVLVTLALLLLIVIGRALVSGSHWRFSSFLMCSSCWAR